MIVVVIVIVIVYTKLRLYSNFDMNFITYAVSSYKRIWIVLVVQSRTNFDDVIRFDLGVDFAYYLPIMFVFSGFLHFLDLAIANWMIILESSDRVDHTCITLF